MVDFRKTKPSKNVIDRRGPSSRGTFKGNKGEVNRQDLTNFENFLKKLRREQISKANEKINQKASRQLTDFAKKKRNRLKP